MNHPDQSFNEQVLVSKHAGTLDLFTGHTPAYATSAIFNWHTGSSKAGPTSFADRDSDFETEGGDSLERRMGTFYPLSGAISACTWTNGTSTISKTGAFASYTWQHLDRVRLVSATGGVLGSYLITSKTSDDAIVISGTGIATDGVSDLVISVATQKKLGDAFLPYPGLDTGWLEWNVHGNMTGTLNISQSNFTWTEATRTLSNASAVFAAYTWVAGDRVYISAGTGAIPGWYFVSSRTSDTAIVLSTTIGGGAGANVTGRLFQANPITFRLYRADPSGLNPTNLLVNPTTFAIPDVALIASSVTHFHLNVVLKPIAPEQGTTGTSIYQVFLSLRYGLASSAAASPQNSMYEHQMVATGTVDLLRESRYYLTYQKPASSTTFDFIPRSLNISHKSPRIFG